MISEKNQENSSIDACEHELKDLVSSEYKRQSETVGFMEMKWICIKCQQLSITINKIIISRLP